EGDVGQHRGDRPAVVERTAQVLVAQALDQDAQPLAFAGVLGDPRSRRRGHRARLSRLWHPAASAGLWVHARGTMSPDSGVREDGRPAHMDGGVSRVKTRPGSPRGTPPWTGARPPTDTTRR